MYLLLSLLASTIAILLLPRKSCIQPVSVEPPKQNSPHNFRKSIKCGDFVSEEKRAGIVLGALLLIVLLSAVYYPYTSIVALHYALSATGGFPDNTVVFGAFSFAYGICHAMGELESIFTLQNTRS